MKPMEISELYVTEPKTDKLYLMVIDRNADVDGEKILKDFKQQGLNVIIVFANYV